MLAPRCVGVVGLEFRPSVRRPAPGSAQFEYHLAVGRSQGSQNVHLLWMKCRRIKVLNSSPLKTLPPRGNPRKKIHEDLTVGNLFPNARFNPTVVLVVSGHLWYVLVYLGQVSFFFLLDRRILKSRRATVDWAGLGLMG